MSVWCRVISTSFYFYSFSCVIYVQSTLHVVVNLLVFAFHISCFVIVNIPMIYVCRFASVMRKQVNYHPLNSTFDPYGGNVHPLFVYQISSGQIYPFQSYKGSHNFEIGSRDQDTPKYRVVLWSARRRGPSSTSVLNLKRIARFLQKL